MKKEKFLKPTAKYLRELSVVVAGIIITFGLSNWISYRNEQKDVQRSLEAVKTELEDNREIVQQQFRFYDTAGKFAQYLASDRPEKLNPDSLAKYDYTKGAIIYMIYKSSAFEMFKSSGTMRLVKDKQLLAGIIDCYKLLEIAKSGGDEYMKQKWNVLLSFFTNNGLPNRGKYDIREPQYRQLYNFFSIYTVGEGNFQACEEQIAETLKLFPN